MQQLQKDITPTDNKLSNSLRIFLNESPFGYFSSEEIFFSGESKSTKRLQIAVLTLCVL